MEKDYLKGPKNNRGQTSVEYILLFVVITSIITSLFVYIKNRYLGDALNCDKGQNKSKILCKINNFYEPRSGQEKRFKYYPFKK